MDSPNRRSRTITFWVVGNSVNGDGAPSELDRWNRLSASVGEGSDNGKTRTVFSGNGQIEPPAPTEQHVDLHEMGAKLRAHWLGSSRLRSRHNCDRFLWFLPEVWILKALQRKVQFVEAQDQASSKR